MEDHQHRLPLLTSSTTTATTAITISPLIKLNCSVPPRNDEFFSKKEIGSSESSTNLIILRLFSVLLIGFISLWATNEANKGFHINILNNPRDHSIASRKFHLLFGSNDRATRLVLETSQFIESLLYPSQIYLKKQVNHVTLQLACQNMTQLVTVDSSSYEEARFVINLNPGIMEKTDVKSAMLRAIGQGMARVWIFDNLRNTPSYLINGLVEYISSKLAPITAEVELAQKYGHNNLCWKDENPKVVARFLSYCEEHKNGFIQRLNQALSETSNWEDRTVDGALGMPAHFLCSSYSSRELLLSNSLDSNEDEIL